MKIFLITHRQYNFSLLVEGKSKQEIRKQYPLRDWGFLREIPEQEVLKTCFTLTKGNIAYLKECSKTVVSNCCKIFSCNVYFDFKDENGIKRMSCVMLPFFVNGEGVVENKFAGKFNLNDY